MISGQCLTLVCLMPSLIAGCARSLRPRATVELAVLLLVAVLVVRTWYIQGGFVPVVVASGSMAETLLGPHREVVCGDCQYPFVCGADVWPVNDRAVCPNCGWSENGLVDSPDLAGDRLLIHRTTFQFRPPRRWEVIAFRHPERTDEICVKRVVGLPGESIEIRDGNLFVDGQILRKDRWLQQVLAVPVYRADCSPGRKTSPPARWKGQEKQTQWGSTEGRFAHPAASDSEASGSGQIDWLVYNHQQRVPGSKDKTRDTPIRDDCGYNQTRPRRVEDTHPVNELLLSFCLVKTRGKGLLVIRASDGREEFLVRLDPSGKRYEVLCNGRPVPAAAGKLPAGDGPMNVELSLFDRQLLLVLDGRVEVIYPYHASDRPPQPTNQPLAIGSQGLGVEICDLRVLRDVYYTHPLGPDGRWALDEPVKLSDGEYFVLGDNSPVSRDSRTWSVGPGVADKLLIGKPLVVHFPARHVQWGSWQFQVPNPGKIRYIR